MQRATRRAQRGGSERTRGNEGPGYVLHSLQPYISHTTSEIFLPVPLFRANHTLSLTGTPQSHAISTDRDPFDEGRNEGTSFQVAQHPEQ